MKSFTELDNRFNEALSRFDFQRVLKAMNALDWRWGIGDGEVPTVEEMKEGVVGLWSSLKEDWDSIDGCRSVSSGGFVVERGYHEVSIQFVITHQGFPLKIDPLDKKPKESYT